MPIVTRPVEQRDLSALLLLDAAYAERVGAQPLVHQAALAFYARSGHAFVREEGGELTGFALAHAVWDGARPALRLTRVAARGDEPVVLEGLLEAVVRSAFDTGVYDLVAEAPLADRATQRVLEGAAFSRRPMLSYGRILGSRGRSGAGP